MKKICLILECYKKNIISVAILLVVLIFALLQSVSFLGRVKYMTYTRDFLIGSNLQLNNTIYFMPMIFEGDPRSGIAFEEIKYGNIPGIESVICPKTATVKMTGKYINVLLCDDSFISTFAPIDQGDWFTTPGIKQDDIVACGYLFEDYSLGSQITVDFGWDTPLPFTFTIVGKKNEPSYLPSFGMQSNNVTAMDLFSQGHNTILVQESKEIDAFLEDSNLYHENCMIKLREDITAAERQEVEEFLLSKGSFLYFNTILENTEKEILNEIKRNLPLPLFLLSVSLVSLVSVSVIMVQKMLPAHSIYRLCGCSRGSSLRILLSGVGLIGIMGGIITTCYVIMYPTLLKYGVVLPEASIINTDLIPAVMGIVTLAIFAPILVIWVQTRRWSPLEEYRREQK